MRLGWMPFVVLLVLFGNTISALVGLALLLDIVVVETVAGWLLVGSASANVLLILYLFFQYADFIDFQRWIQDIEDNLNERNKSKKT